MNLEELLKSTPPEQWKVGQLYALGWYDGPESGVCSLAVPGGEFYFEMIDERYNPDGLDDRIFRLSELPAGSVADVLGIAPNLGSKYDATRKEANVRLEGICARKLPTTLIVHTQDWEHFLGCWKVDPTRTDITDWFSLLNIPAAETSYSHVDQERGLLRGRMWSDLERTIEARLDRYLSVNHQWIIANHYFAQASHECLLLYRDGYFTSCNMVAQAISEGILRFIADRNQVQPAHKESKQALASRMQQMGIVSQAFVEALGRILGSFRNDFHHMNPAVATRDLEGLAMRNITDLAAIEREIFDFAMGPGGTVVPTNVKYWDLQPDGSVPVYVRGC